MAKKGDYEVGYKKPPAHTQFQKGQSGNPSGRPKGSINLATALERELHQRITVKEGGRTRTITKLEAAVKQLINKAASGDPKALALLLNLKAVSTGGAIETAPAPLDQGADREVLAALMRRFTPASPAPPSTPTPSSQGDDHERQ